MLPLHAGHAAARGNAQVEQTDYLALPHLSIDLGPTSTETLWIIDIYGFLLAGFLITMGTLGDRIGRRRLLMAGAVTFGLAALVAAYAANGPEVLIAARALMGIAGTALLPSTLALITNMFQHPAQRTQAIGVWAEQLLGRDRARPLMGGCAQGLGTQPSAG